MLMHVVEFECVCVCVGQTSCFQTVTHCAVLHSLLTLGHALPFKWGLRGTVLFPPICSGYLELAFSDTSTAMQCYSALFS